MPSEAPVSFVLAVRAGNVDAATRAIRAAVSEADPLVPWVRLETLDVRLAEAFKVFREITWFGTWLGALALFLAAAGLYAVMAYTVRRRTREIGIRMAIGARAADVMALVLREGLGLAAVGAVAGVVVAAPLALLLRSVFFAISPLDPQTVLASAGALLLVAVCAAALPAYRAVRVDPVAALRGD